jgi:hypothetical protein
MLGHSSVCFVTMSQYLCRFCSAVQSLADFVSTSKDLELKLASALTRLEADFTNVDDCVSTHAAQTEQYSRLTRMFQQLKESEKSADAKQYVLVFPTAVLRFPLRVNDGCPCV